MSLPRSPRVLAVADSDSYLKWAAGLVATLPAGWARRTVVLRSPITPSAGQRAAALAGLGDEVAGSGGVAVRSLPALLLELRHRPPDVLLLACTGPVVDLLVDRVTGLGTAGRRPVLVSGLPGLCVPASPQAWRMRAGVDLFVVHSRREQAEFSDLGHRLGATGGVGLARLPFLRERDPERVLPHARRVVFAAQAKVPPEPADRRRILLALDALARDRPDLRPVVKLRARAGEQQTHRERHPYDELWADLVADGSVVDGAVAFVDGALQDQLDGAHALVTVSSTAALEAMAASVPVLVLGDFGVDEGMLNLAFAGSGCVGDLSDLVAGRFLTPCPTWLADNYFHRASDNDWTQQLETLVALRHRSALPARPPVAGAPGPRRRRRHRWRLAVPPRLVPLAAAASRGLRVSRRALTPPGAQAFRDAP